MPLSWQVLKFFTARKRSLRRLCFCTCLSFCPRGGCLLLGGLVPGGACSGGDACSRGVPGGDPPNAYCCGRYASYWNTFLFGMFSMEITLARYFYNCNACGGFVYIMNSAVHIVDISRFLFASSCNLSTHQYLSSVASLV